MRSFDSEKTLKKQIHLFLDNELPKDEASELINLMELDPRTSQIYNSEKDFRAFVKNNVKRSTVSEDFAQNIKDKIRI
jgi:hypothetical protein